MEIEQSLISNTQSQANGKGLSRGGKLDQEIWNEFSQNIGRLNRAAAAIGQSAPLLAETRAEYNTDSDEDEFPEGQILTRLHLSKERNHQVVARKKSKVLRETGRLACEACGFDFFRVYGQLGHEFIECHYTVPIAELNAAHRTRISELAVLCANCHRIIHRSRPMLTVGELQQLVQSRK